MARPKIMEDSVRILVQLERKDHDKLKAILQKEGTSVAKMFREAVAVKLNTK
jgi:hypothetical protein